MVVEATGHIHVVRDAAGLEVIAPSALQSLSPQTLNTEKKTWDAPLIGYGEKLFECVDSSVFSSREGVTVS